MSALTTGAAGGAQTTGAADGRAHYRSCCWPGIMSAPCTLWHQPPSGSNRHTADQWTGMRVTRLPTVGYSYNLGK